MTFRQLPQLARILWGEGGGGVAKYGHARSLANAEIFRTVTYKISFFQFFPVCTCVLLDHAAILTTHKIMMPRRSTRPTKTHGKTGFLTSTWWLENEHKCLVSLRWTEYQYKNSFALTVLVQMSSCTLLHVIQNSMEAILVCHPSPSTKGLDWVAKWCVQWRLEEGPILPKRHH